jgi:hypothetical protein
MLLSLQALAFRGQRFSLLVKKAFLRGLQLLLFPQESRAYRSNNFQIFELSYLVKY